MPQGIRSRSGDSVQVGVNWQTPGWLTLCESHGIIGQLSHES